MKNKPNLPILGIIRESDAFPGTTDEPDESYDMRRTVRVMLEDSEGKFGFILFPKRPGFPHDYYTILGGGVNKNETYEQALHREVKEEVGCEIEDIVELGKVFEYGIGSVSDKKYKHGAESHFYYAKIKGKKGKPSYDAKESASSAEPVWLSKDEAIQIFENQIPSHSRQRALILFDAVKKLHK